MACPTEINISVGASLGIQETKNTPIVTCTEEAQITRTLDVPEESLRLVGQVIGRGGKSINDMRAKTGCGIIYHEKKQSFSVTSYSKENVSRAVRLLKKGLMIQRSSKKARSSLSPTKPCTLSALKWTDVERRWENSEQVLECFHRLEALLKHKVATTEMQTDPITEAGKSTQTEQDSLLYISAIKEDRCKRFVIQTPTDTILERVGQVIGDEKAAEWDDLRCCYVISSENLHAALFLLGIEFDVHVES